VGNEGHLTVVVAEAEVFNEVFFEAQLLEFGINELHKPLEKQVVSLSAQVLEPIWCQYSKAQVVDVYAPAHSQPH
jgi:hypothetical protein